MKFEGTTIICPAKTGKPFNEAEVLGLAVWLMLQSETHKDLPLMDLPVLLLPAIKHGQFILGLKDNKPVFFMSWAEMNAQAEARYIDQPPELMPLADWHSGDRIWCLDWVTPFGHSPVLSRLMKKGLFANRCIRSLYHRGDKKGIRVMQFHGRLLSHQQARQWFDKHPIIKSDVALPEISEATSKTQYA